MEEQSTKVVTDQSSQKSSSNEGGNSPDFQKENNLKLLSPNKNSLKYPENQSHGSPDGQENQLIPRTIKVRTLRISENGEMQIPLIIQMERRIPQLGNSNLNNRPEHQARTNESERIDSYGRELQQEEVKGQYSNIAQARLGQQKDEGSSNFPHAYSAILQQKVLKQQKHAENSPMPVGKLLYTPLQDRYLFISNLIKGLHSQQKSSNPSQFIRILVISPSLSIGEQLFKELIKFQTIKTKGEKMASHVGLSDQPLIGINFCNKNQKQIKSFEEFEKEVSTVNLVVISAKLVYELILHGVIQLHTFQFLIFEDLTQQNDQHQVPMMKDYYYDRPQDKKHLPYPTVYAIFNQKPQTNSDYDMKLKIQTFSNDYFCKYVNLTKDEIQQVIQFYGAEIKMLSEIAENISEQLKFNQRQNIDIIVINDDNAPINFSSETQEPGLLAQPIKTMIFQNKNELDEIFRRMRELSQRRKYQFEEAKKSSTELSGRVIVLNMHQVRNNALQQFTDSSFFAVVVTKERGNSSTVDIRELIMHLAMNNIQPPNYWLIQSKEDCLKAKYVFEENLQTFQQKVHPIMMPDYDIHPSSDIQQLKQRKTDEYFQVENGGKITIKDSGYLFEEYLQLVVEQCNHSKCRLPSSQEQILKQGLNLEFAQKNDQNRQLKKPFVICKDQNIGGKQYFTVCLVMPNCFKHILNYQMGSAFYIKKKDAENNACLLAIEKLYNMGYIDKYLFLKPEVFQSKEKRLDQYPTLFRIDNGHISQPLKPIWENSSNSQALKTLYVNVFAPKSDLGFPFKSASVQYSTGFITDRPMTKINLDFQLYQEVNHLQQHINYLVDSGRATSKDEAIQMIHPQLFVDFSMSEEIIEIPLPSDKYGLMKLVQTLKFYHVWSFYQMMNFEHSFIKGLIKGKFTFSEVLFMHEILILFNKYGTKVKELIKQPTKENFTDVKLLEAHHYLIPVKKQNSQSQYEVDFNLIESAIRYIKMKILSLFEPSINMSSNEIFFEEISDKDSIKQKFWGYGIYRQIVDIKQCKELGGMINYDLDEILQKEDRKQQRAKTQSLPDNLLKSTGFFTFKYKQIHKFKKLQVFLNGTANKVQLENDKYLLLQQQNEQLMQQVSEEEDYLETHNIQLTLIKENQKAQQFIQQPSQFTDVNPISTYEQYFAMQLACSHFLKLNDYLRTEKLINQFFSDDLSSSFGTIMNEDTSFLKFKQSDFSTEQYRIHSTHERPKTMKEFRQAMFRNLPLINEALTSPHSQLLINYERLEIYGDSLISFLVILEVYLTREPHYTVNDLDDLRKQRISNEAFIILNCRQQIYKYMLIEPQSQLPQSIVAQTPTTVQIEESKQSKNKNHTIMRSVTPGGMPEFQTKVKGSKLLALKAKLFRIDTQIEEILSQREQIFKEVCQYPQEHIPNHGSVDGFCNLLRLVLTKEETREELKKRFPFAYSSFIIYRSRHYTFESIASSLHLLQNCNTFFKRNGKVRKTLKPMFFTLLTRQDLQIVILTSARNEMVAPIKLAHPELCNENKINNYYLQINRQNQALRKNLKRKLSQIYQNELIQNGQTTLAAQPSKWINSQQFQASKYRKQSPKISSSLLTQHSFGSDQQMRNLKTSSSCFSMELRVTRDKKMADVIEALGGAVLQICGLKASHQFLCSIGVLGLNYEQLSQALLNEQNKEEYKSKSWKDIQKEPDVEQNVKGVEETIGYVFKKKQFLIQALTHKSYADYRESTEKFKLQDYNLLEFLGDSILNFLVLDFLYRHSRHYREYYPPNVLHKLKSEIVNNDFLSLIMIENGLSDRILMVEMLSYQKKFKDYVDLVKKETEEWPTWKIYQEHFASDSDYDKEHFMKPQTMQKKAQLTMNLRQSMEDISSLSLKVFGDVFEALVAAVFLDSGGDLQETQRVFINNILKPYLYVYGNPETLQEHPRTEVIDIWNKEAYTNLRDKAIRISHLNEIDIKKTSITYRGFLAGRPVLEVKYPLQEKNKVRKFYKQLKGFIEALIQEIREAYPNINEVVKRVNQAAQLPPNQQQTSAPTQASLTQANFNQMSNEKRREMLESYTTTKQVYDHLIIHIQYFRKIWSSNS